MLEKKTVSNLVLIALSLTLVCGSMASAQTAKKAKRVEKVPVVSSTEVKVKSDKPAQVSEELADYKDEVNAAIGDLKSQLDKVKSDNSDAKVSGTLFFRWQKYISQNTATAPNNFDIDRAYIDVKKNLAGDASMRFTLDVSRLDTTKLDTNKKSQNLFEFLKYAYVDLPVAIPANLQVVPASLSLRLGQQTTAWIDWADKMLGQRWIAKSLLDNEGVMSSADLGVGALGTVTLAGLPVDYQATAVNGSGYKAAETDAKKSLGLRLTSTVVDSPDYGKLIASAFYNEDGVTSSNLAGGNSFMAAELGLKNDTLTVYYEYLNGTLSTNINGYSTGLLYNVMPRWNAFCRFDRYDPNVFKANDQIDRTFYGITFDWTKDVKIAADVQNAIYGSAASSNAGMTNSVFYLHTLVNF